MASTYSEKWENLPELTKDLERARESFIEEFQAIDWYQQRIDSARNEELKKILAHNRDEEKEHAALIFEWIKKNDPEQARALEKSDFRDA